jgi:hypothetical protein
MKMIGKAWCIIFGMTMLTSLVVTGCGSNDLTVQEILTNTQSAVSDIDSYKIAYDMVLDMEIVGGEQAMKMSMDGTGIGSMDVPSKKMQMSLDVDAEIPGTGTTQMKVSMTMDMYMVNGWLYTKMTIPTAGEQWTKANVTGNEISQDQLAQLHQMLKTTAQSSLTGTEKVNGVNCYVLELTPSIEELWNWMMSQQGGSLTEGIDFSEYDISKLIKSYELKYWISKSDYHVIKAYADINMDMEPGTLGASLEDFDRMTMLINMNMTFSDYNVPVNIELPADAAGAEEVSP